MDITVIHMTIVRISSGNRNLFSINERNIIKKVVNMRKTILGFAIIAITIGSYDAITMWKPRGEAYEDKPKIKVRKLQEEALHKNLVFQGLIVPKKTTPIYTDTSTAIEAILVNEGEIVSKGTKLFEFNEVTRDNLNRELEVVNLDLQNKRLQLSDISLGSIKLELDERELEMESLKESINSLNREIKIATFEAKTLREKANIMEKLLKSGGISTTEANKAIAEANRKENGLKNLRTSLALSKQKYDLSLLSYQKLRRNLLLNQNSVSGEHQKLLLEKSNINRKLSDISESLKAPVDGIVIDIAVEEGDSVPEGSRLLSIASVKDFLVKLEVPLRQFKSIEQGQEARVFTKRYFEGREYTGEVSRIANIAKSKGNRGQGDRVIEVEILVKDAEGMKPGFLAEVELKTDFNKKVVTLTPFSIINENGTSFVYVLDGDTVHKTEVKLGKKGSTKYEVLNLALGTEVVVNPFKVKDGQKVEVIK